MTDRTSGRLAEYKTSFTHSTISSVLENATANLTKPQGCQVVRFENTEFLPWDNPDNIISAEVEDIARRVKDTVLPVFFLIGGPANVINMAVYYKQGLKNRVNLCLFALSLADELVMIQAMFLFGEQIHVQFTTKEKFGPLLRFMANNNLSGFYGFSWVSQILSAIVASERCLCVLSPLRFQTLLQTRTMAVIITAVYLVVVGFYFLVATRYRIACVFDPSSNTVQYTLVAGEFYQKHQRFIKYLDVFIYGTGIPAVLIIVVTTATITTAMKIRQAATWRAGSSSASGSSSSALSSISPQELALTKMLIGVSVLFIVCISPFAFFRLAWLFMPEIEVGRRKHNFYLIGLWTIETFSFVNSSFNIFVYYTMGSRYRDTFWSLCGIKKRDKTRGKSCKTSTTVTSQNKSHNCTQTCAFGSCLKR